jgi:ADP-heptose:LPS heptosyltransferase
MMDKYKPKRKLIFRNEQSPGDICMLAYAIKALHEQYPGKYITDVSTFCNEIFEGNPYITELNPKGHLVKIINLDYPTIHQSNQKPHHFVNGFAWDLAKKLKIHLEPTEWTGAIYIREEEKGWLSAVHEELGYDPPFWCIAGGHKWDYRLKAWDFSRFQEIVDRFPEIKFVQIGAAEHNHPQLTGNNLLNFVGKTDLRQLIRLIWHSFGVITPISLPMHLAYAIPPHPRYNRKSRGCIVIAGGREPNHWQAAANQQFIHTCGMLDCCDEGGCWLARSEKLNDGDEKDENICHYPIELPTGQIIGKCMDMISVDEVCLLIKKYMDNLDYKVIK